MQEKLVACTAAGQLDESLRKLSLTDLPMRMQSHIQTLRPHMLSGSVYECMPACERESVSIIAASDDTSDGHLSAHARLDDEAIALVDAGRGQVQMPQLIALEDVDARIIQHELRVEIIDDRRQHEPQPPQVLCISSATRQVLVPILRCGAGAGAQARCLSAGEAAEARDAERGLCLRRAVTETALRKGKFAPQWKLNV